jgi:hypothetical protein
LWLSALLLHERLTLLKLFSGGIAAGVALMIGRKWLDKRQRPNVAGEAG